MALIIQKFGGTSVASTNRIKTIIPFISSELKNTNKVIVVVSAMAGATNHLITLCNELSHLVTKEQLSECDAALCSAEMVTASLLALALQENNIKARSVFAWQLPIITNENYGQAIVESVSTKLLKECLEEDIVPVIAGFQGVNSTNKLATLGRGGSDTTASVIAAAMKADRCDIYTDVDGVFSADPRIVAQAKKISHISFEEMLELSSAGAKVIHPRAVELACRYNIPIHVLSSFSSNSGTLITSKNKIMENRVITAITSDKNLLKIIIEKPIVNFAEICNIFVQNNIHIEWIQNMEMQNQYSFITKLTDKNKLQFILDNLKNSKQIDNFIMDNTIAMVTVIGHGIKSDPLLLGKICDVLHQKQINIIMVNLFEVKIMLLIKDSDTETAIRILHDLLI